jgi:prepilin-type N-terminal cleavage/methylation domain-containing protein
MPLAVSRAQKKNPMKLSRRRSSAMTLLEMMIAVAIVADLAVIAIPNFERARKRAQNGRFANDLRIASSAFEIYATENDKYPPEAAKGVVPTGMEKYFDGIRWTGVNSLNGQWDWDYQKDGAKAAICTESVKDLDNVQMTNIDTMIDNGAQATGQFRKRNEKRYAMIIE